MKQFYILLITLLLSSIGFGQVFITEIADPNNDATARYVELYNSGASSVDLSTWALRRWTNENATPQSDESLSGVIAPNGFIIFAVNSTAFWSAFPSFSGAVVDMNSGGPTDSNGDDNIALINDSNTIVDIFGVPGEDGSGTNHEFEDGRAERKATVTNGNATYTFAEWNIWNDTGSAGTTNDPQDAPSDFDPGEWIGFTSSSPTVAFDSGISSESETDATFNTNIPVTMTNYDAPVTISVAVNGSSTAESGDYTLNTTSLSFSADETKNISLDINDDVDSDNETVILDIAVTSGTADLGTSQHTVTITDDDLPNIVITEIMYNTPGTDDEWVEIFNADVSSVDISGWTIDDNSGTIFTFPGSTTIASGAYLTIALGSNGDGSFNNNNPFTPDYNSLGVANSAVKDENDTDQLGNTSDILELKNGGSTIDAVAYDDGDASSTDGNGPSYEIIDTSADNSLTSANWQASAFDGGSPGGISSTSWTGTTDNDWSTASNWSAGIPSANSDILISTASNGPTASSAVTVNSVTINSGASLIAQSSFSGSVIYNRDLSTTNWYLISSPVVGQDVDDFVTTEVLETGTGNNLGLGTYNTNDDTWSYYQSGTSNADTFIPGQGYVVNLSGASGDIAFTGTLLTTDLTPINLVTTGNGFNLAGNSYPSFLDSNAMLIGSSAALDSQTLWIWDQSSNGGLGSYITKVSADNFKIAPGQGFFVQSDGAAGTLAINESFQSHESSDSFLRNELRPEIHLNLTNGTNEMMAKLYFISGTTTGFDNGYDGPMFGGISNPFAIYTQEVANATGRNLAIQSLPDSDYESMVVPIGVNSNGGETVTFTASSQNLPDNLNVYLEDNVANQWTLLNTGDYVFTPSVDLSGTGRFFLHFTTGTLSAEETILNGLHIYADNSNRQILINGQLDHNSNAIVYDMQGRIVLRQLLNGNTVNNIIETNTISLGLYVVEIKNNTQKRVQKIIIN